MNYLKLEITSLAFLLLVLIGLSSCSKEAPLKEEDTFGDLTFLDGDWMIPRWTKDFDGNTDTLFVSFNIAKRNASIYNVPDNPVQYKDGDLMYRDIKQVDDRHWSAYVSINNTSGNVGFVEAEIVKDGQNVLEGLCPSCGGSGFSFVRIK